MNTEEINGANYIPASQRPDGTWRKPRRVKEGYVPQEEVPLYESKGKQAMNRKPLSVASPNDLKGKIAHNIIPGLFISEDKKEKKKKEKTKTVSAPVQDITKTITNLKLDEPIPTQPDPAKRLKNLRKRLREIETLEQKIKSGEIKNPEKEQLDKVLRKNDVLLEIKKIDSNLK